MMILFQKLWYTRMNQIKYGYLLGTRMNEYITLNEIWIEINTRNRNNNSNTNIKKINLEVRVWVFLPQSIFIVKAFTIFIEEIIIPSNRYYRSKIQNLFVLFIAIYNLSLYYNANLIKHKLHTISINSSLRYLFKIIFFINLTH